MATVTGTAFNDILTGTPSSDIFFPGGGDDAITGNGGFDLLDYRSSPAAVTVNFASGIARDGFGGTDTFTGIAVVFGSSFSDTLTGGNVGIYALNLYGRQGDDAIIGSTSNGSIFATYSDSPVAISANIATGQVQDGWGTTDTLTNIVSIQGSEFDDTMLGGAANDRFRGGGGNDTIDGGGGTDNRIEFVLSPSGVSVDLQAGTAQDGHGGSDTLRSIQRVAGSRFGDSILGSDVDNFLQPAEGSDTVDGRSGYDTVSYDYTLNTPPTVGVTGNLTTGVVTEQDGSIDTLANIEALWGTPVVDDLTGRDLGAIRSNLRGLRGNDILRAPSPGTRVTADYRSDPTGVTINLSTQIATDGWGGTDTLVNINAAQGSAFSDNITGSAAADYLTGNEGNDQLFGGDGDDLLAGDAGNDLADGGAGFDTVNTTQLRNAGTFTRAANNDLIQTRGAQVDTLRSIEQITFLDGRMVFDAADPAAAVARLYQAALGRPADQGGLNFWIDNVQAGIPLSALATGFLSSPEFTTRFGTGLSNEAFVTRIYQNVLGRAPDPGGLQFWTSNLDNGAATRGDTLAGISESVENKAGTAALVEAGIWDRSETAAQIARLYDTVFSRLPDIAGLTFWKAALNDGTSSLGRLTGAFTGSAEFQATYGALSTRDFVSLLYVNALNRPADAAGLDFWANGIDSQQITRSAAVLDFSESAEHQALSASIVGGETRDSFGITFVA